MFDFAGIRNIFIMVIVSNSSLHDGSGLSVLIHSIKGNDGKQFSFSIYPLLVLGKSL